MKLTCQFRRFLARTFIPVSFLGPKWLMGCSPSASLVIGRVFETQERKKVILFCSEVEDFAVFGDPSTQGIFSLLRALTYEVERLLDLPRHGAARVCPWLSTAFFAGSVRRGRVSQGSLKKPQDRNVSPILVS